LHACLRQALTKAVSSGVSASAKAHRCRGTAHTTQHPTSAHTPRLYTSDPPNASGSAVGLTLQLDSENTSWPSWVERRGVRLHREPGGGGGPIPSPVHTCWRFGSGRSEGRDVMCATCSTRSQSGGTRCICMNPHTLCVRGLEISFAVQPAQHYRILPSNGQIRP
jgi:hypothetical protein